MSGIATGQFALFLAIVVGLALLLGPYLARVFSGERTLFDPVLRPVERVLLRAIGRDAAGEMTWQCYAWAFVRFTLVGTLVLFVILMIAGSLPGGPDPAELGTPLTWDLSANTAVSFATTTTWQAYGGEDTMPYVVQLIGLAAQNFLAGAAGLAIGIAFIRGFARTSNRLLGNFWVDLVRATLWVLLPAALVGTVFLIASGVPMSFDPYTQVMTLEGGHQVIAQGPVAALEFIKNGVGEMNAALVGHARPVRLACSRTRSLANCNLQRVS